MATGVEHGGRTGRSRREGRADQDGDRRKVLPGEGRPGEPGHRPSRVHWESWALRAVLVAVVAVQAMRGNPEGLKVGLMGFVLTLIPRAVDRLGKHHVPRLLELTFVLAIVLQFASESFKLFELFTYWDKIVHPSEIFLATGVALYLLLGYRHVHDIKMPDGLSALAGMVFGMTLGAAWELIEFAFDWFGNANLQKSNADTMTDILTNDAGAIFGALLAFWLYRHTQDDDQKEQFGRLADWMTDRLGRVLERHGKLVGIIVALIFAAIIFAGWYIDRGPIPPAPTAQGTPASWSFGPAGASGGPTEQVLGLWRPDQSGICQINPSPQPRPGSEKMGLLGLGLGSSYGQSGPFAFSSRFAAVRPPLGAGTAMDTGLAFGIRGPEDFYLLHASEIHDVVALDRYIHGRKRGQREEHVLLRANEWHELRLELRGDRVTAALDGRPVFEEGGLVETDGGIGLWSRETTAGCFNEARVETIA